MKRRAFITLMAGAVVPILSPRATRAQQPAIPVVGFLHGASPGSVARHTRAFVEGLREAGHVEGKTVAIEFHWADGQYDRLPILAADLVRRRVSVIAASGNATALAAKAVTATIPIVFFSGVDPVQAGLVASLNRPDGNITGVTSLGVELAPKRLELLRELLPRATVMAALANPANRSTETQVTSLRAAARTLGLELHILHASTEHEIDAAFAALAQLKASALVIAPDGYLNSRSEQLAVLTLRHSVPTIYTYREFAAAGGLMSYGADDTDSHRQVGVYAGRILKGEKVADLPVQQTTKVELIINMKTAKALGLTVPITLLGRADEVIE